MTLPLAKPAFASASPMERVEVGLRHVAAHVAHAARHRLPGVLVDGLDVELGRRIADEAQQHAVEMILPGFGVAFREIDADDREILGENTFAAEIVDRRHDETLREVAEGAEDDDGAGVGRLPQVFAIVALGHGTGFRKASATQGGFWQPSSPVEVSFQCRRGLKRCSSTRRAVSGRVITAG